MSKDLHRRVTITIPKDLAEKIERYRWLDHRSRSAEIVLLLRSGMNAREALPP